MSDASDALRKTAAAVGKTVDKVAEDLGDAAATAAEKAGDAAAPAWKEAARQLKAASDDPQSMDELFDASEGAAVKLGDATSAYARREPIKSILWAAAAGALAMALIQRATSDRSAPGQRRRRVS